MYSLRRLAAIVLLVSGCGMMMLSHLTFPPPSAKGYVAKNSGMPFTGPEEVSMQATDGVRTNSSKRISNCQTFGIMLPKSGSSSLAKVVEGVHEWEYEMFFKDRNLTRVFRDRNERFIKAKGCRPDVDPAYSKVADQLCDTFPDGIYYNINRNVYSWISSFIAYSAQSERHQFSTTLMALSYFGTNTEMITSQVFVESLGKFWCDFESRILPKVRSQCNLIEGNLDEIQLAPHPLNKMAQRGHEKFVNKGSFRTDLFERPELLAIINRTIDSQCPSLSKNSLTILTIPENIDLNLPLILTEKVAESTRYLADILLSSGLMNEDVTVSGMNLTASRIAFQKIHQKLQESALKRGKTNTDGA